jgi:hypothetical protein
MRNLFRSSIQVTQQFGVNPDVYKQYGLKGHEGLDCIPVGPEWTVLALADGQVIKETDNPKSGNYGINATIFHPQLKQSTQYCHLAINNVTVGQQVKAGEAIGMMGATGNANGAHVHLNLFNTDSAGKTLNTNNGYFGGIDPLPFVTGGDIPMEEIYKDVFDISYPGKSATERDTWVKEKVASKVPFKQVLWEVKTGTRLDFGKGFYGHDMDTQYGTDKSGIPETQWGQETRHSISNVELEGRLADIKTLVNKPL